jgi:hypothetical protein
LVLLLFFYWIIWVSYIFWILTLSQLYGLQIFHLLIVYYAEASYLMPSHLSIFAFIFCLSYAKESSPRLMSWSFSPMFSCHSSTVFIAKFVSVIHLEFHIWWEIRAWFHSSAYEYPFFKHHLSKTLSFPHYVCECSWNFC